MFNFLIKLVAFFLGLKLPNEGVSIINEFLRTLGFGGAV